MKTGMDLTRIRSSWVVLAIVLLVGILSMAYGYYANSSVALLAGLIVTAAGALNGILRITLRGH